MRLGRFLTHEWLPAIVATVRPTTLLGYRGHVERHINPVLGGHSLGSVDPRAINALYAELLASGLSPATVRRVHATLHRALRDAVRWGHLELNAAERADPPRAQADGNALMHTWEPAELKAFLRAVRCDELYPLWLVLAMTGMRRGEALGLRWADVDVRARSAAIRQTIVAVGADVVISSPKTARGRRVIALDATTARCLGALRRRRGASGSELVFAAPDGGPLNPCWVSKRFAALVRASGLPRIRLHDLRHTHATLALRAGVHPKIVSERLGHSTVAFTLDVYSHTVAHLQKEAAARVAALVLD
ncbi:MAG: tyrosine-type recombinase/integrase [Actinomycetota bacterium]